MPRHRFNASGASTPALPLGDRRPERLVGLGFRSWMAGYETGDVSCWEQAWNLYASELGVAAARTVTTELSCWVRKIRTVTGRGIVTFPIGCRGFCRDECTAIAMIAASQHKVCPALRACTYALIGCPNIDEVMHETDRFAFSLADLDQHLSPDSIQIAPDVLAAPSPTSH